MATADRRRQLLARRAVAVGAAILLVVLAVQGIRGCLDARKERAFASYFESLASVVGDSRELSHGFFERLNNPPEELTELDLQAEIRSDRATADEHLRRLEDLDPPDELSEAERELALALDLRRDALGTIAERIPDALGDQNRHDALGAISRQMRVLLASDALYRRARQQMVQVLEEEGIEQDVPGGRFVPDPVERYLNDLELAAMLAAVTAEPGETVEVRGVEILSTTIDPGEIGLAPDSLTTVSLEGRPELAVQVHNSGEVRETNVQVQFSLTGGPETMNGSATIDRIGPGSSQTASLPLRPPPPTETELTLMVTVMPVPGETLIDNNQSTYRVAFE